MPDNRILVSTVWHSGTHSLREMLNTDVTWEHCSPYSLKLAKSGKYERVVTSYRDPYRVAASWCNRIANKLDYAPHMLNRWHRQWTAWLGLKDIAEVYQMEDLEYSINTCADHCGLHKALDDNDMGYYFTYVPKNAVQPYAQMGFK